MFCSLFVVLSFPSLAPELQRKGLCQFMMKRCEQKAEGERGTRACMCVCVMPKCTLINGCSINQWNIIKLKHCDFLGRPLKRCGAALCRARGDPISPVLGDDSAAPDWRGCQRSDCQPCITLACCEARQAIKRRYAETQTLIPFDVREV